MPSRERNTANRLLEDVTTPFCPPFLDRLTSPSRQPQRFTAQQAGTKGRLLHSFPTFSSVYVWLHLLFRPRSLFSPGGGSDSFHAPYGPFCDGAECSILVPIWNDGVFIPKRSVDCRHHFFGQVATSPRRMDATRKPLASTRRSTLVSRNTIVIFRCIHFCLILPSSSIPISFCPHPALLRFRSFLNSGELGDHEDQR
jgi:hypothetical protein